MAGSPLDGKKCDQICEIVADLINDYSIVYPIDAEELARKMQFKIRYYDSNSKEASLTDDAYSFFDDILYKNVISVNRDKNKARQKFSILHEISHIVLASFFMENGIESNKEKYADYFAGFISAPPCLLMYYQFLDLYKIQNQMDVSYECAENTLKRLLSRIKSGPQRLLDYEMRIIKSQNGNQEVRVEAS